jgi:hypothetical protein
VDDIATIPFSKEVLFVFKVDENEKYGMKPRGEEKIKTMLYLISQ